MELYRLGSIFRFREEYYVWLGADENGRHFTAKILGREDTEALNSLSASKKFVGDLTLCFVVLTTPSFEKRAAHLGRTDTPIPAFVMLGSLNDEDIASLKAKILGDEALPKKLKEVIEKTAA